MCGTKVLGRDDAVNALAERLYSIMDRIDPAPEGRWEELDDEERGFYRDVVRRLVDEDADLLHAALAAPVITK